MEKVISLEQFKSDKEKEMEGILTIEQLLENAVDIDVIIEETRKILEEGNLLAVEHPMGVEPLSYILMKIDPNIRYVVPQEIVTRKMKTIILLQPIYKEESKPVRISEYVRLNNSFIKNMVKEGHAKIQDNTLIVNRNPEIDFGL